MPIHPTAIVDRTAEIDPTADIGAYAVVEPDVRIGPEVRLYPHAYISRGTTLGPRCQIHPFAVVGHLPQDLKFSGEPTYTEVGADTVVREHATIHRGTMPGSKTLVGHHCYIMATGHIGHNCTVGNHVIIANAGLIGGHITLGDRAFVSGCAVIHQFTRIGELAMIGGGCRVTKDVPPFMIVGPQGPFNVNVVGLRRAGYSSEERLELRECFRILYREETFFPRAIERVAEKVRTAPGRRLVEFLQAPSKRGYLRKRRAGDGAREEVDDLT